MSTNRNTDAVANQEQGSGTAGSGEFKPRIQRDEPMMTGGHQPGKLVGNDAKPEFEAETLPPGSAPASRTFQPNNPSEIPPQANMSDRADPESEDSYAADTITGATSGDVHTGLGHPGTGQTSSELRDNSGGRQGLQGVGASGAEEFKTVDERDPKFANHRAIDNEDAEAGQRGTVGGPAAEERIPVDAANLDN